MQELAYIVPCIFVVVWILLLTSKRGSKKVKHNGNDTRPTLKKKEED